MWAWILVGIMAVIIVLLLLKIYALQSAAKEMESVFADRLSTDTNTLIGLSSTASPGQQPESSAAEAEGGKTPI